MRIASGVYAARLGSDNVLFSSADRRLHVLNDTAWSVWNAIAPGRPPSEITSIVAIEYDVAEEVIASDVTSLLTALARSGLCSEEEGATQPTPSRSEAVIRAVPAAESKSENLDEPDASTGDTLAPIGPLIALGVPMTVSTDDRFLHLELTRILDPLRDQTHLHLPNSTTSDTMQRRPPVSLEVTAFDGGWHVRRDGEPIATVGARAAAIRAVVAECNSAPLEHIDDAIVFHAAAADLGRGVVVFPGVSNAGKSTLVTQLLLRGHAYLTDEAVAVDLASLQAKPFTKSISIEPGSQDLFVSLLDRTTTGSRSETWDVDPRSVGAGRLSSGGAITAIVFASFDPSNDPEVRPLDRVESLRKLLANTFVFDHIGQAAFDALVRIAEMLPCYSMIHHGDDTHIEQLEVMFSDGRAVSL